MHEVAFEEEVGLPCTSEWSTVGPLEERGVRQCSVKVEKVTDLPNPKVPYGA